MAQRSTISSLLETTFTESPKVDREAKVIRGVKILGRESKNGYEYSDRALTEAATLYDGTTVNVNHPERSKPNSERAFEDGIGVIRAAKVQPDGVFGDLHYVESHPYTGMMLERAERFPNTFGLSHNADGRKVNFRGKTIVESVTRVRSVDLVGRPATNSGLFESENQPVKTTIKALLESAKNKKSKVCTVLREMVEGDPAMAEMPMEPMPTEDVPADADGDGQIDAAFRSLVNAVLDDDKLDVKGKLAKIKDILNAQEKLTGEAPAEKPADEPADEEEPSMESQVTKAVRAAADKANAALLEEVRQLRAERDAEKKESAVRSLLESMDRDATPVRIKALTALAESDRKALVESWPKRQTVLPGKPRREVPLTESEAPGEYKPLPAKEWASLVR